LARVTEFALSEAAHRQLAAAAAAAGIPLFSTALTEDWVPLLAELFPAIKIASGDLTFEPVIRAAVGTGRPVLISTGLGTLQEIEQAVAWATDEIGADTLRDRVVLMQCVSAYPTPVAEANVAAMAEIAAATGLRVGYSNHVQGPAACHAAAALGAPVIEVHVTDRREGRQFRDHALSFEPAELAALVGALRAIRAAVGAGRKERMPSEAPILEAVRKGVVAARDLPAGTVLSRADLAFARPATEVPNEQIDQLIGRQLPHSLSAGMLIPRSVLDPGAGR